MTIEVLDIRESTKTKSKHIARGELDIAVKGTGMKILNIPYTVRVDGRVFVNFYQNRRRSIHFEEENFKETILTLISEAILEHHRKDLEKTEDPAKNGLHIRRISVYF